MSHEISKKIIRKYRIKESVLKQKLGLLGDVNKMELYSGLSMNEEEAGESHDKCVWEFVTIHTSGEKTT